jgi:hypothetical protein
MDVARAIWDENEVLETLDDVLDPIWTSITEVASDHWLDKLDVVTTDLTSPEEGVFEIPLPEWVGLIRKVEASNGSAVRPFDVDQVELERQHAFRGIFSRGLPVWIRGLEGFLRIIGRLEGFDALTVWYIRKWPPMHYGQARQAIAAPSTTEFLFDNAVTLKGRVIERDDIYNGLILEFSSAGNVDHLARITDYDGATQAVTFTPAAPTTISDNDTYSLVLPTPSQHNEYVKEKAIAALLETTGQDAHIATIQNRLARLEERFYSGLRQRDNARPRTTWNRR